MTGLQILQSCLEADATRPKEHRILVNSEPLRNILLRDVSLALLRTLGLVGEPGAVIASAFSAVLTLLHVQGAVSRLEPTTHKSPGKWQSGQLAVAAA